jgi:hypothetical protein
MNGSFANPSSIICGNDAADPPTATSAAASVTTSGSAYSITVTGIGYIEGITFNIANSSSSSANMVQASNSGDFQSYKNCNFVIGSTGGLSKIVPCNGDKTKTVWTNCSVKFASSSQRIAPISGFWYWRGGSILAGGTQPSTLISLTGGSVRGGDCVIADVDLSNGAASMHLVESTANGAYRVRFNNIKLPSAWTGDLIAPTTAEAATRVEMYNAIVDTSKIYLWAKDTFGSVKSDTTIYRSGGAAVGTDAVSMKLTTSASVKYPAIGFESTAIERAYPGTSAEDSAFTPGVQKTVSVDFVHDSSVVAGQGAGASYAFQNNEFVLEVITLDSSGNVVGTVHSSAPANVLTAATDIGSSTQTFTTTGMTTPVKQRLSVPITPYEKGTIRARIIGYAPNKTIYYCPKLTVA